MNAWNGHLFDRDVWEGSPAWKRLNDPSPPDHMPETVRLKHDTRTVITGLMGAIQEVQSLQAVIMEQAEKRDKRYDDLCDKLFDPTDGAFIKLRDVLADPDRDAFPSERAYVKGKLDSLSKLGWGVLGGVCVGTVMLIINLIAVKAG